MSLKTTMIAAAATVFLALPAFAGSTITIEDPYARTINSSGTAGAAFMQIINTGEEDDQLLSVSSDVSEKTGIHEHIDVGCGMVEVQEIDGGLEIPAGETSDLKRGANQLMFLDMPEPLEHGDVITVTLTFEKAGDVVVEIPVDLER